MSGDIIEGGRGGRWEEEVRELYFRRVDFEYVPNWIYYYFMFWICL
jgi:hypothetical protein